MKPAQEIRLVKENLALAITLWQAAQKGRIGAEQVLGPEQMGTGHDGWPADPVQGLNSDLDFEAELTRCTGNQVRAAFTLSVLQTQRSLESVFPGEPIDEPAPDLQAARAIMHLMDLAVDQSMLVPQWDCPRAYRRFFEVRPVRLVLDSTMLHGQPLNWDQFGGLEKYLDLLEFCAGWAERAPADPPPETTSNGQHSPASQPWGDEFNEDPDAGLMGPIASVPKAHETEGNPVEAFVAMRCETGGEYKETAKELYAGFVAWCQEAGHPVMAQRSFGMRLTGLGLRRRRRGRGRHWWEGIRLASPSNGLVNAPAGLEIDQLENDHQGEFQLR